jgi:hypothetical protein
MTLDLPPDPSLRDLQLPWEAQFWEKSQATRIITAETLETFRKFFGDDRKPRDIFRCDVAAYKAWAEKKGWSPNSIRVHIETGSRFYNLLNELELVEAGFNPFLGMAPRRVTVKPR